MTGIRTAGELADYLATQPRDRRVILDDGESWSVLAVASEAGWIPDGQWAGEAYEPGAAPDGAEAAVILGPVP
jgi:hypothetical protein